MQMPFGKHAGKSLSEIPTSYLLWVLRARRRLQPDLRQAIGQILAAQGCPPVANGGMNPSSPDSLTVIRQWYRGLVLDYHPDRGGSQEAMQIINEAHERLRRLAGL